CGELGFPCLQPSDILPFRFGQTFSARGRVVCAIPTRRRVQLASLVSARPRGLLLWNRMPVRLLVQPTRLSPSLVGGSWTRHRRLYFLANAAFLVIALVFGAPGLARAQAEHRVSLIYVMDPGLYGCPSRAEFQGSVSRQLGYDPFRDEAPRQVIVRSELTATGLRGQDRKST